MSFSRLQFLCAFLVFTSLFSVSAQNGFNSKCYTLPYSAYIRDSAYIATLQPEKNKPASMLFVDRVSSTKIFDIIGFGLPIVFAGSLVKMEDNRYGTYQNPYPSTFKSSYDDYLQYAPAAIMLGMKLGGVKGRSSWGRMLSSDAFTVAIMVASVNALKYTMDTPRPDGSTNNSFPSGHTATAFMTATMLSKEFGHISPWITVGAYSIATATAMGRQLNTRHWLSDLMVGAGIGVISTELGYFFADLIFKDKGLKYKKNIPQWDQERKPSFFGLYAGISIVLGGYYLPDGRWIDIKSGNCVGYEGAWFPHKNVGIGGRITVGNNMLAVDKSILEGRFGYLSTYMGPYYSLPLSSRWSLDGKTMIGYNFFSHMDSWNEVGISKIKNSFGFCLGTSLSFLATDRLRVSTIADYNIVTKSPISPSGCQHNLYLSVATNIMF